MSSFSNKIFIAGIFAISMGFLEAVVVVYLREIYYPEGFHFPLTIIEPRLFGIELVRELTTLVMLLCIGLLAGKSANAKFAWFLFTFGIWDIFYYVGLKLFLDWPESLLTWDILFLIPITWIGPVLAPIICSVTMIIFGIIVGWFESQNINFKFGKLSWLLLIVGAILIFLSFVEDYSRLLLEQGIFSGEINYLEPKFTEGITSYIPGKFNWLLFLAGEFLILTGIYIVFRRGVNSKKIKV